MSVTGFWMLTLCVGLSLIVAAIVMSRAERGGSQWVPGFFDPFIGCCVPLLIVLAGVILGLVLWLAGAAFTVTFG